MFVKRLLIESICSLGSELSNTIESYLCDEDAWRLCTTLPRKMHGMGVVAHEGKLERSLFQMLFINSHIFFIAILCI